MTLIAYSALLQGAYTRDDRPVPAQFAGPDADERLIALKTVADEVGATLNQVIIAWMLHSDPFVLPIIAASKLEQLTENIGALDVKLTKDQMTRLNTAGDPDIKQAWLR
jgi:aryl-alcohol dehydrogenase-like predicted oxidoreductase